MKTVRGVLLGASEGERAATPLELFFDLCFVVAVAQVATVLLGDPTWEGAAICAGLFVPIWWAWMAFTWHATAYDRDDAFERIGTLAGMLGILALAIGVPDAAEGDGTVFAAASAVLRIPLLLLWLRAWRSAPEEDRGFSARYMAGTGFAIALWGLSTFASSPAQEILWAAALLGEIAAPYAAVRRLNRPAYDPDHIVERYGLFTIIVLGESILAVVAGTAQVDLDPAAASTAAMGFAVAAAFWWIYFDRVGAGGLGHSRRAGFTWGYGHLAVWAGLATVGVGTFIAVEAAAGGMAAAEAAGAGAGAPGAPGPLAVLPLGAALAMSALSVIARTSTAPPSIAAVRAGVALVLLVLAVSAESAGALGSTAIAAAVMIGAAAVEVVLARPG